MERMSKKEEVAVIKKALNDGTSVSSISALTGRSIQTIQRIKDGNFDWMLKTQPAKEPNENQQYIRDIGRLLHTIANQNEQIIGILDSIRKAWV